VALRAALAEIERLGADRVICLGDVPSPGPQPREVLSELRRRDIPMVLGNTDADAIEPKDPGGAQGWLLYYLSINAWAVGRLDAGDRAYLAQAVATIEVDLDGAGALLCAHGSPRSYNELIEADTPAEELDAMLAGLNAAVVATGHTHVQLFRRHRQFLLVNPGSVGMPPSPDSPVPPAAPTRHAAWAEFGLIDAEGDRFSWSLHRAPYDVELLFEAARFSGMPYADWWTSFWRPPE
jgi:predicted phosphodiesterase